MRTVAATRYVTPLREGGSLPAIVEGDDGRSWVVKFRGAGQGPKSLVAEIVVGEIARALELPVPEIALVEVDAMLGRSEPDPEIQSVLRGSVGLNVGLGYLPGALGYDGSRAAPDALLASRIVWLDAYCANVDRTPRNPNLLVWHQTLQLIDHGAALYFHHDWSSFPSKSAGRFPQIKGHVLLPLAAALDEADRALAPRLTPDRLRAIVDAVPDSLLEGDAAEARRIYLEFLTARLASPRGFVEEAAHARAMLV